MSKAPRSTKTTSRRPPAVSPPIERRTATDETDDDSADEFEISVVLRSRNDIGVIEGTLDQLLLQDHPSFEIIALDNDSTDGTAEAYRERNIMPSRVPAGEYNPGRVLNRGVELARGRWIVFVNSDCTPGNADFLRRIVEPLDCGTADFVYGRQAPRTEANTLVRRDHRVVFGAEEAPDWLFFSMAASAFPRALLRERPIPEDVQYSEDLAWAVAATRDGLRLQYVPEALALHSHNYTVREYAKRFFEEGRADAHIFGSGDSERPFRPVRHCLGTVADVGRDAFACLRARDWRQMARSPAVRTAQRMGYVAGRLAGPRKRMSN